MPVSASNMGLMIETTVTKIPNHMYFAAPGERRRRFWPTGCAWKAAASCQIDICCWIFISAAAEYSLQPGPKAAHPTANSRVERVPSREEADLSFGIVSFVAFPVIVLAAILPGAILVNGIEYDTGDALMP